MPTCAAPSWVSLMKRAGQIRLQLSIICQHPFRATANQVYRKLFRVCVNRLFELFINLCKAWFQKR